MDIDMQEGQELKPNSSVRTWRKKDGFMQTKKFTDRVNADHDGARQPSDKLRIVVIREEDKKRKRA
jgi:hypothetical protein